MKPATKYRHIAVDKQSIVPIYLQVAQSVVQAVKNGRLKNKQRLPSINLLSERLHISRDSAERAYRHLKKTGVIVSIPQKGYYIGPGNRGDHENSLLAALPGYTCYAIVPYGNDQQQHKQAEPVAFIMIR